MDYTATKLPERDLLKQAFRAGFEQFSSRFAGDDRRAEVAYQTGPVAMAQMIWEHGGECRHAAAAVCLAGPSVFTQQPSEWLSEKITDLSREVLGAETDDVRRLRAVVPTLSPDARLFLQVSAVHMLQQVAGMSSGAEDLRRTYFDCFEIYKAARGLKDTFNLDGKFEAAAATVNALIEDMRPAALETPAPAHFQLRRIGAGA